MNIELMDYFAAKAMAGMLADPNVFDRNDDFAEFCTMVSDQAYVMADAMLAAREAWTPEKKSDGWIKWNGGANPVAHDTVVGVRLRAGGYEEAAAWRFRWDHLGGGGDIIAYRVVQS